MYTQPAKLQRDQTRAVSHAVAQKKNNKKRGYELVDNRVVQCLRGATGTAQEGKSVPYTLNQEFITKHVAENINEAVSVTEARIGTGQPPGMVAGKAPNHLAKKSDWESAIDSSDVIVPPIGEWSPEDDIADIDDTTDRWIDKLVKVEVHGWEAIGTKNHVTAKIVTNKKYLGGKWTISDRRHDDQQKYIDGSGNVTIDISHLTS